MNLEALAKKSGVTFKDCGNGHIQLKGDLLVNYYPESKFKSAYIAGTTKKTKHVSPEQAIALCFKKPELPSNSASRKKSYTREKARMLKKKPFCHWCDTELNRDTATIEHIIPLGVGGLDNANNRALACNKCNSNRGSDMPELSSR